MPFTVQQKLIGCLFLFILTFLALFTFEVIIPIIITSTGLIEKWPSMKSSMSKDTTTNIVIAALLVPVIEEIVGRLWIVYNRGNISLPVSLAAGIATYKIFGSNPNIVWYENYRWLFISIVVSIIAFASASSLLRLLNQDKLKNLWTKHQRKIILLSAFIFAALHYRHYDLAYENLFIIPFLLAFYFSSGLILGYARVKYGFIYCCLIHILYNSFLLLIKNGI